MEFKRTTVTAALLYANGPVHIGHLAGCYIPADVYVRFLRSKGQDVIFVTGSDEHGVPITIKAQKEGLTPQQVVDKYHAIIKDTMQGFGISPDIYSRTSNPIHHETSQDFFKTLYDKGVFTEETTEQYFDQKANQFLADRYIIGTCPVCSNDKAYGDQCEKCGSTLSPEELINPHSALSGEPPIKKSTKNWYLPLDKIQPKLEKYVGSHPEWKSNVFGQCQSWLKEGLKPRAMTRDLDWGIKVPVADAEGKVLYVWFDAPIGYISMTKELFDKPLDKAYQDKYNVGFLNNEDHRFGKSTWKDYWQNEDTRLVHFIGKDNIVFHCLIFPAMLMEHGKYILADNVPANEFLNLEGDKISTSRNWAVWAHEYLQDFPGKEDALRYFLISNAPETKDNNFTWKDFQTANNSELVGILGNFVNRTVVLTHKYFEGKVPELDNDLVVENPLYEKVLHDVTDLRFGIERSLEQFKFRDAVAQLMDIARVGNKFLAETEPWKLYAVHPDSVKAILNISLQISANLAILMEPFMPFTSKKLFNLLNLQQLKWRDSRKEILEEGHPLSQPFLLFEKIEDDAIEAQILKLKGENPVAKPAKEEPKIVNEAKQALPNITYDDFAKLDLRVGTIIEAEKVEKADKLLKLKVDIGTEVRTVVSGIALHFKPEEIIGTQVTLLANLEPRKLKGIESQGMILMASDKEGKLVFVNPNRSTDNGSEIK